MKTSSGSYWEKLNKDMGNIKITKMDIMVKLWAKQDSIDWRNFLKIITVELLSTEVQLRKKNFI